MNSIAIYSPTDLLHDTIIKYHQCVHSPQLKSLTSSNSVGGGQDANNNSCSNNNNGGRVLIKRRVHSEPRLAVSYFSSRHYHRSSTAMKKLNSKRYRSGSSSDSAITLDNVFEDDDEPFLHSHLDVLDDLQQIILNFVCLALEEKVISSNSSAERIIEIVKRYYDSSATTANCSSSTSTTANNQAPTDKFGFVLQRNGGANKKTGKEAQSEFYLESVFTELLNARSTKFWFNLNNGLSCGDNLKCFVREYGIPNELRPQIWLSLIKSKIEDHFDIWQLLSAARRTAAAANGTTMDATVRQIELDVTRTMPQHQMFDSDSEGIDKLRRILIAYSVHSNPVIGYCQAMNFIGALLLVVFEGNEHQALMGLLCIIDRYFPPHYYDQQLTGVRADQLLLKDLILSRLDVPLNKHTSQVLDEITNSLSLNWFLSLFHNALPWQVRLYVLDCFLLEGSKVLFRFAVALLELEKDSLMSALTGTSITATGELINKIRSRASSCFDVLELKRIAFGNVKIPRRKHLATRRAFYVKQLNCQVAGGDHDGSTGDNETAVQWIRRRSTEILGLTGPNLATTSSKQQPRLWLTLSAGRNTVAVSRAKSTSSSSSQDKEIEVFSCQVEPRSQPSLTVTLRQPRGSALAGVSDDGSQVILSQSGSQKLQVCTLSTTITTSEVGVTMRMASFPYELLDSFYQECSQSLIGIGKNGVISSVALDCSRETEMVHLGKSARQCVLASALDTEAGLLYVQVADASNNGPEGASEQLFVVDATSLDVFNCIDLGNEAVVRLFPYSGQVIVARHRSDGTSVVSLTTPSFSRQLFAEAEHGICDLKSFPISGPIDGDASSIAGDTFVVVALFNSGKITCVETSNCCVHTKRSTNTDHDSSTATIVTDVCLINKGTFLVTLFHASPASSVQKISFVKF